MWIGPNNQHMLWSVPEYRSKWTNQLNENFAMMHILIESLNNMNTFLCSGSGGGGQNSDENCRPSIHLSDVATAMEMEKLLSLVFWWKRRRWKLQASIFQLLPIKNEKIVIQHFFIHQLMMWCLLLSSSINHSKLLTLKQIYCLSYFSCPLE